MRTQPMENGVASELQRIEREFHAQRDQLAAEESRFASWEAAWEERQLQIDVALAQLKVRLSAPDPTLTETMLKLYTRHDPPPKG